MKKASWLMDHPDEVARIARAGMDRLAADGHDVTGRMRQMLEIIGAHAPALRPA